MTDLHEQFQAMEVEANKRIISRSDEINTAVIALLARQHHLSVGAPGVAKSLLVDTLTGMVEGAEQFSILMHRQSKVEELYGPISFKGMEEDTIRFNTDGFLPKAHLFFGDEIWKASTAQLQTLLWILNERKFRNDKEVVITPLIAGFFASNEFPDDDRLRALYDRITFKLYTKDIWDHTAFIRMLKSHMNRIPVEPIIHLDDLYKAHAEVDKVNISDEIMDKLFDIRNALHTLDENPVDVSSRTFANSLRSLQATAYLRGDDNVTSFDIVILRHILWQDLDQKKVVAKIVQEYAAPLIRDLYKLRSEVEDIIEEIEITKAVDDQRARAHKITAHLSKIRTLSQEANTLHDKVKGEGLKTTGAEEIIKRLTSLSAEIRPILSNASNSNDTKDGT